MGMSRRAMTRLTVIGLAIAALAAPAVAHSSPAANSPAPTPGAASQAAPADSGQRRRAASHVLLVRSDGHVTTRNEHRLPRREALGTGAPGSACRRIDPASRRAGSRMPGSCRSTPMAWSTVWSMPRSTRWRTPRSRPDPGSINPYRVGADRYAPNRKYRITVPADDLGPRGRNFLDVPDTNAGAVQELIYRVYLPDGKDDRSVRSPAPPRTETGRWPGAQGPVVVRGSQRHPALLHLPDHAAGAVHEPW